MSAEIKIGYTEVYSKTAALRKNIDTALSAMEESYAQITPLLDQVDGGANAVLQETVEENRRKAQMAALTMRKLLTFMENSARQMETIDQAMEAVFTLGPGGKN